MRRSKPRIAPQSLPTFRNLERGTRPCPICGQPASVDFDSTLLDFDQAIHRPVHRACEGATFRLLQGPTVRIHRPGSEGDAPSRPGGGPWPLAPEAA